MSLDASFWALVGLIIFFVIMIYYGVPGMITRSLDGRAERIQKELDEARQLREEAQALLAEYQRKRREAEEEAEQIVSDAKAEAERMTEEANAKLEDMIARRTKAAEDKISQAENQAIAEVRAKAADLAIAASERILSEKVKGQVANDLIARSLDDVKARLN
ncbi:F0F1 ATP synthase subunit B [Amorphus orientalis]|uniref:ATP synthase subunit b n=1 Tax=Amorphus orientalis TaxID=649198 RepID=A0AAE3VKZ1_9HYPH|nr:F0F1 ATP synthase subunit B [Amorphus orientalis]MDQ0313940.1 F-type H+-transporting ATPase subunit b [Amorphus orientalis]